MPLSAMKPGTRDITDEQPLALLQRDLKDDAAPLSQLAQDSQCSGVGKLSTGRTINDEKNDIDKKSNDQLAVSPLRWRRGFLSKPPSSAEQIEPAG